MRRTFSQSLVMSGHVGVHRRGHGHALLERDRLVGGLHHPHDVVEVHQLQVEPFGPGLDARRLQHVVHHLQQYGAVLLDLFQLPARRRVGGIHRVGHEVGERQDGGQRRAQLVAHDGQEVGLVAVVARQLRVDLLHAPALAVQLEVGGGKLLGALGDLGLQVRVHIGQALRHVVELLEQVLHLAAGVQAASVARGRHGRSLRSRNVRDPSATRASEARRSVSGLVMRRLSTT